ncbi:MAG: rRNA maturation RNase YbeY [Chloroflexota bacterium]
MIINIQFESPYENEVPEELVAKVSRAVLDHTRVKKEVETTIVLAGDETLRELNSLHLGIDAPTDVLSFPADEFDPDEQMTYIGDVIISIPRAKEQARVAGHPLENEISLLIVHGILHLLGYDHDNEERKAVMWKKQAEILTNLGIHINQLPE